MTRAPGRPPILKWLRMRRNDTLLALRELTFMDRPTLVRCDSDQTEVANLISRLQAFDRLIYQEQQRQLKMRRELQASTYFAESSEPAEATCTLAGAAPPWQWTWGSAFVSFSDMPYIPVLSRQFGLKARVSGGIT